MGIGDWGLGIGDWGLGIGPFYYNFSSMIIINQSIKKILIILLIQILILIIN